MSSNIGSSSDSSAAAWAGATLSAAEAYAEAEADAAAAARDQAERNAASGVGRDGVDRPPTAEERAQNAFWGHDPNRPPTSNASGESSPGANGEDRVSVHEYRPRDEGNE